VLLCVNGWRYREIARAAAIDRSQIAFITARGRQWITAKTERRICGVDPADRPTYMMSAWDTRRAKLLAQSYEQLRAGWEQRHPEVPMLPTPGEWSTAALCAQIDNEIFFPDKGGSTREAKRVCLMCEVRRQCLDFALEHDIRYGIFGGLSVKERLRQPMMGG
jgi:WhiB family redox-sensing transcriptional regulator